MQRLGRAAQASLAFRTFHQHRSPPNAITFIRAEVLLLPLTEKLQGQALQLPHALITTVGDHVGAEDPAAAYRSCTASLLAVMTAV